MTRGVEAGGEDFSRVASKGEDGGGEGAAAGDALDGLVSAGLSLGEMFSHGLLAAENGWVVIAKDRKEALEGESTYTLDERAVASGPCGDDGVAVLQIGVGFLALDDHLGAAKCIASCPLVGRHRVGRVGGWATAPLERGCPGDGKSWWKRLGVHGVELRRELCDAKRYVSSAKQAFVDAKAAGRPISRHLVAALMR